MIIVFEGIPGGGKTTQIKRLGKLFGARVIPEIIDQSERWREARRNDDQNFFWRNDIRKYKIARQQKGLVLIDRAHPSTLAYNYAKWIFHDKSDFIKLMRDYFVRIDSQNLKPDAYVFFSLPLKSSITRKGLKINKHPWRDPRYLEIILLFYNFFFRVFEPDVPIFYINATQKRSEVLKKVIRILNRLKTR